MGSGAVWFDLPTDSPSLIRRLHEQFAARGLHLLDAPVSGGPKGPRTRKLALWVGGDRTVFDKYKTVLDALGDQAMYVRPIGAGPGAKLRPHRRGHPTPAAPAGGVTPGAERRGL